jgi:hypothetical protein
MLVTGAKVRAYDPALQEEPGSRPMASSTTSRERCFQPKFFSFGCAGNLAPDLRGKKVKVRLLIWRHRVFHNFLSEKSQQL